MFFTEVISLEIKKTQTKAFSNLIASLVLIAFEVWAWLQTALNDGGTITLPADAVALSGSGA